jgi:1-acyl-sn-glycerol-3-phosphate acyltransferase
MIIFPEGTRSRGGRMGEFRRGSLKLATRAGATVVPITIDGTWRIWEERKRISPAEIAFVIHPPIATEGMGPEERRLLPDRIRSEIASGLGSTVLSPAPVS